MAIAEEDVWNRRNDATVALFRFGHNSGLWDFLSNFLWEFPL